MNYSIETKKHKSLIDSISQLTENDSNLSEITKLEIFEFLPDLKIDKVIPLDKKTECFLILFSIGSDRFYSVNWVNLDLELIKQFIFTSHDAKNKKLSSNYINSLRKYKTHFQVKNYKVLANRIKYEDKLILCNVALKGVKQVIKTSKKPAVTFHNGNNKKYYSKMNCIKRFNTKLRHVIITEYLQIAFNNFAKITVSES